MPCELWNMPGGVAFVKRSRPTPKKCAICGKREATYQCDFPTPTKEKPAKTCDAFLCARCLVPVGPDRDYCPHHPRPLFGEVAVG
jgi:hypothetical protein